MNVLKVLSDLFTSMLVMAFVAVNRFLIWWQSTRCKDTSYYFIDKNGNQLPLTDASRCDDVLIVYYPRKYLFLTNVTAPTDLLMKAYKTCTAPLCPMIGIEVQTMDKSYSLKTHEFMVARSTLFTPTFNKWLCKYVLNIAVTPLTITVITSDVKIIKIEEPVHL